MFSLVIVLSIITANGAEIHRFVMDHGLTAKECFAQQEAARQGLVFDNRYVQTYVGVDCVKEGAGS
jgi:hypothetical protein